MINDQGLPLFPGTDPNTQNVICSILHTGLISLIIDSQIKLEVDMSNLAISIVRLDAMTFAGTMMSKVATHRPALGVSYYVCCISLVVALVDITHIL